jgi:hypothetical protein
LRGSKARLSGKLPTFTIHPLVENARKTARGSFILHFLSSRNEAKSFPIFYFLSESHCFWFGLPNAILVMLDLYRS